MAKKLKKTRLQKLMPIFKSLIASLLVIYISFFAYKFLQSYEIKIKSKSEGKIEEVRVEAKKVVKKDEKISRLKAKPGDDIAELQVKQQYYQKLKKRPKYWFYMGRQYMWIFFSVDNVLQRLGLEKIEVEIKHGEIVHNDWDLLWSYDYHNEIPLDFKKIKYHQRINHIPGNYVITMKDYFTINTDSKYVPKAFNDTEKIKAYAAANPGKRFLQKLWSNRGIVMKKAEEMNFDVFGPGYKYFGQEYVENPLLIDGYKFDFGIYVLVSSVDPLRIYFYEKNTLIRLCAEKYDANNFTNVDSYVISDACLFPWDLDALSMYYNQSYTYKESLNAYLTKNDYDVGRIWTQVEDCIREIVVNKEEHFKYWMRRYSFKHTFFELYRFDFILDNDLNLYLIEVNQSPNVNPSALLYRDQRLFENLLYNVFTLIGVGHYMPRENFQFGNDVIEAMVAHEDSWTVMPETCITSECSRNCSSQIKCSLCKQCMTNNQRHELHLAYREAKNRGAMRRIFPPPQRDLETLGEGYLNTLSNANRWLTMWYTEMCKKDADFC